MMKNISLFIILLATLFITSCEKDVIGEQEDPIEIVTPPVEIKLGSISGIIYDENNNPIEGATIIHNKDEKYLSDVNGYFKIANTGAPADGALLKITKDGYFNGFKFAFVETQKTAHLRIQMIEKKSGETISGINGGTINIGLGASAKFPERAFVDKNNVSYEGSVTIYTHWYNPVDAQLPASMPGDLRALSQNGKIQQLATFGMMAVELYAEDGTELNLAEGITATLTFPIPTELSSNAPNEIATWSFNEQTAFWEEESIAVRENNTYIAEVSHFSFWNCDIPYLFIHLKGTVINTEGQSLPWNLVCVTEANSGITGSGYTNSSGQFSGFVPKNEPLILSIKDECGEVVFEQNIGPFSSDSDLGELIGSDRNQTTIQGSLRCNGQPIENGYVKITLANGAFYIAETDQDGNYSLIIEACVETITIQGFDIENNRVSSIVTETLDNSEGVIEVVPFEVCQDLEEFIRYKIGDSFEEVLTEPTGRIIDGNLQLIAQEAVQLNLPYIEIELEGAQSGNINALRVDAHIVDNGNNIDFQCGSPQGGSCENITFVITAIGGVGEFIEGTFMGEGYDLNGEQVTLMGSFRVALDFIADTNGISGTVWADTNEDGIRQSDEQPLEGVEVFLTRLVTTSSQITDAQGRYAFEDIFETSVQLEIDIEDGFELSLANQGTNESLDSDFETNPMLIEFSGGEYITNFDAGIHSDGNLICNTPSINYPLCAGNDPYAEVTFTIESGMPPFDVYLDGELYTTSDTSTLILQDLSIGEEYEYLVTDENNKECSGAFSLVFIDFFDCSIDATNSAAGLDNGTATVLGISNNIVSAIWSNGQTELSIDGLAPDTYSVTVTDDNGCTSECEVEIIEEGYECFIEGPTLICDESSPFELLVNANFNVADYLWSNSETTSFILVNPMEETSYSVTVSNGPISANCSITIQVNSSISCTVTETSANCDMNNGSLTVEANGGGGFFTYLWNNSETSPTIYDLEEGTYSVTATDQYGCSTSCFGIVESGNNIECDIIPAGGECGSSSGSATVEVFNGSGNYAYVWNNGSNQPEIIDLVAGDYSVTITDIESGCTTSCNAFVESAIDIELTVIQNQSCNNGEYLTELIVLASGGAGDYTYEWSFGGNDSETETDQLGNFSVVVTDLVGCSKEQDFEIEPSSSEIGNLIWMENGVSDPNTYQENEDNLAEAIQVILYDAQDPNNLIPLDTTITDQDGRYLFSQLIAGDYILAVSPNLDLVEKDLGDDNIDSDFDPNTGMTDVITLDGCNSTYDIDAGIN